MGVGGGKETHSSLPDCCSVTWTEQVFVQTGEMCLIKHTKTHNSPHLVQSLLHKIQAWESPPHLHLCLPQLLYWGLHECHQLMSDMSCYRNCFHLSPNPWRSVQPQKPLLVCPLKWQMWQCMFVYCLILTNELASRWTKRVKTCRKMLRNCATPTDCTYCTGLSAISLFKVILNTKCIRQDLQ